MSEPVKNAAWTRTQLVVLWLLLGGAVANAALGWFPLIGVEGDDLAIACGAWQMAIVGRLEHALGARYDSQPLTTLLPAALQRAFGVPALEGLCLLTILGFVAVLAFGAPWIARQADVPVPLAGLALLLLPEVSVSSYYGNANMIAAGLLAVALFLAGRPSAPAIFTAGVLYGVAVFVRLDALAVSLAFPILLWAGRRRTAARLALFGGGAAAAAVVLLRLSDLSLAVVRAHLRAHETQFLSEGLTLSMYLVSFPALTLLLGAWGAAALVRQRRWQPLLLAAAGTVPLMLAYRQGVVTPKYLLYALPFCAVLVACGLGQLAGGSGRWRLAGGLLCLVLLVGQYALSGLPRLDEYRSVVSHDGPRQRFALLYEPLAWHRWKTRLAAQQARAEDVLCRYTTGHSQGLILTQDWLADKWVSYHLLHAGHTCLKSDFPPPIAGQQAPLIRRLFGRSGERVAVVRLDPRFFPVRDWPLWRQRVGLASHDEVLLFGYPSHAPREMFGERATWQVISEEHLVEAPPVFGYDFPVVFRAFPLGQPVPAGATP